MGQPSIIEVSYQNFLSTLQRASNAKKRIDATDKERWSKFVREHNIPEAGMAVKARSGSAASRARRRRPPPEGRGRMTTDGRTRT